MKRRFALLSLLLLLLPFYGCSPPIYTVGYTLHNGKPALYMPICEGWRVDYFGVEAITEDPADSFRWTLDSEGGNTNFFVLGVVPDGYRLSFEHHARDLFPSSYKYQANIRYSAPGKSGRSAATGSGLIDFSDAEEEVLKSSGGVTTRSELDADMAKNCG